MFDIQLTLSLVPKWHVDPPHVIVTCGPHRCDRYIEHETVLTFDWKATDVQRLEILFDNKTNKDSVPERDLDKSVLIHKIDFFGISDPKFIWLGRYQPIYPEPWASQQRRDGRILQPELTGTNCLGWNGTWWLDFDLPIFTWIHRVQNLGWLHA